MAASSFLDSEATFAQQAEETGLGRLWIDALKASSLATFAKLSFAVTSPGTVASDDQINTFLGTMRVGVAPSIADMAAFKRLLFESQTLMMHSFKATAGEMMLHRRSCQPRREKHAWSFRDSNSEVWISLGHLNRPMPCTICVQVWSRKMRLPT